MPIFEKIQPTYESSHWQYKAGNISVVAQRYLLGQYRLQIWYGSQVYPEIMSPEC